MNRKPGLTIDQHKKLQAKLLSITNDLTHIYVLIANAYPKGPRAPRHIRSATSQIVRIEKHILDLRVDYLENQFFVENPELKLRDLHGGV